MLESMKRKIVSLFAPKERDVSDAGVARRLGVRKEQVIKETPDYMRHELLDLLDKVEEAQGADD